MRESIWVFPVSEYREVWLPLCRELAAQTGYRPVLFVSTENDASFYERALRAADDILVVVKPDSYQLIVDRQSGIPRADLLHKARAIETKYDIGIVRDIVQADRHMGRSYMLGAQGYPVSHTSRAATWTGILDSVVACFEWWEQRLAEDRPRIVVAHGGGTGIAGKPPLVVARRMGAEFRTLASARFGNLMYWADDEYENSGEYGSALIRAAPADERDLVLLHAEFAPTTASVVKSRSQIDGMSWRIALRRSARALMSNLYWKVRGYRKAKVGATMWAQTLVPLRTTLNWLTLRSLARPTLADLKGRDFVFFPLQMEPEASLYGQAPDTTDQLHYIVKAATNLPADAVLAVKEHIFGVPSRTKGFYAVLARLPNVVLVDPLEASIGLIKSAKAVCAINSSVAYEAAAFGKTVFLLSPHGPLRHLDHVHVVASEQDWKLLRAPVGAFGDCSDQKMAGARYFRATRDYCMTVPLMKWRNASVPVDQQDVKFLVDRLLMTLPRRPVAPNVPLTMPAGSSRSYEV